MKKENRPDLWQLAIRLEGVLGADLDPDEEDAIREAIRLICPEYAAMRDRDEQDAVDWFESQTPEQIKEYAKKHGTLYPLSPDSSGTPAVPPVFNGKALRFGEEKNKK